MEDRSIDPHEWPSEIDLHSIIDKVDSIIAKRQASSYIVRFFQDAMVGRPSAPMDRVVARVALERALATPAGRKAAGLPRVGRGGDPRFNAHNYGPDSEAIAIGLRYRNGKLTRAQAREQLALAIEGEANIKTLDKLLDDLGRWGVCLQFPGPLPPPLYPK